MLQAAYWQRYAELELDEGDTARAKLVFSRCLLSCPHIRLWSLYLRFIKKVPPFFVAQSAPRRCAQKASPKPTALHRCLSPSPA